MFENIPNLLIAVAAVALVGFALFNVFGSGSDLEPEEQEQVRTLLASGEAVLVDVRTPGEFSGNGLEGANNIPVQQLDKRLGDVGDKDDPVVVYCRSGSRSARAAQMLEQAGFEKVYDLGSRASAQKIVEGL